jgi:Ni,Fe-hydrogenase III component G
MGGVRGNWLVKVWDSSPKIFFRGDDGTFLLRKKEIYKEGNNSVYELSSAYPSDYNLSKEDELNLTVSSKNREMLNSRSMELVLNIKNSGQSSYAIQAHSRSEHFTVEQNVLSVVKQGESRKITLNIHAKLSRENPKPLSKEEFNLTILTGNGSEFNISVPISVRFSNVFVEKAEESKDEKTLNIELKNSGNEKIEKATVRLLGAFDKNITQSIVNLEPNATVTVPFSTKGFDFEKNKKVEVLVSVANEEEMLKNPSGTKIAPAYVWHSKPVVIVLNKLAWYVYALWAIGILALLGLIVYYKRYKNPLVV